MPTEVIVAYTRPDGLAAAKATRSDLVLCNSGLPGMSGYEIARELSTTRTHKEPFLVALTSRRRTSTCSRCPAQSASPKRAPPLPARPSSCPYWRWDPLTRCRVVTVAHRGTSGSFRLGILPRHSRSADAARPLPSPAASTPVRWTAPGAPAGRP